MTARRLIWLLLILWLATYVWSILYYFLTPATDFGFTRGLNRVSGLLQWQLVAGVVAGAIWFTGRRFAIGTPTRRISRGPALFALLPFVAMLLLIIYVQISNWVETPEPASAIPMPVAEPAD